MHIHERFPEKLQAINQLIAEDPDFLSLCEDYEVCIKALKHWTDSKEPTAKARFKEYRILVRNLEEEIQEALSRQAFCRSVRGGATKSEL